VVIGVPIGAVRRCQQFLYNGRIRRRLDGGNLGRRDRGRADSLVEEAAGGSTVTLRGDEHVDDLPELVDRPVDIAPLARDLHGGLLSSCQQSPTACRPGRAASASRRVKRSSHR
jgi:hypothetical protein